MIVGPIHWAQKADVGFLDFSMAEATPMGAAKPPITSHEVNSGGAVILVKRSVGITAHGTDVVNARVMYRTT